MVTRQGWAKVESQLFLRGKKQQWAGYVYYNSIINAKECHNIIANLLWPSPVSLRSLVHPADSVFLKYLPLIPEKGVKCFSGVSETFLCAV